MIVTMLTAATVYVATGIDYLVILILLFSQIKKGEVKHIWIGQYIGTAIIIGVSLFVALGVANLIPQQWVIGLLGLLPLYLGVKIWIKGEGDEDESKILSLFSSGKFNQLFVTVTFIVLASSADDFSIYVPYFTTLNMIEIFVAIIVFLIMVGVLCYVSYRLASLDLVSQKIEKYERWIVPIVFIGLGVYIMFENDTFDALISFLL
ncbi:MULTISPECIES: CadD family cadmium resistance transporter [Bacillaceae]|jgi:cadmium resistance transport/sequestration family protein|uniref:Cadmium resistance transporter n=2 Tax=Bacillaceae TaxID=186817 RepID=D3G0Z0_ALKPO|nr:MULTISPECIES: CadD family cadmium resistance transporter [Bacillaceae]ADC52016.1 putative cadmium resistance transporter [Alkalihalophilus pseudofirmus OF4]MCM3715418.1 CadD family cadmium resistance transporter [Halalkalibacter oceani]MEC2074320.1 CadD family cadmium resistance transporter [Alkalihalophilus marmarensis]